MSESKKQRRYWSSSLLPLVAVAACLAIAWWAGVLDYFSLSSMIMHRAMLTEFVAQNWLFAIAVFFAVYAVLVAISFPGASLLTIASGFMFGGISGAAVTVLAATAGACAIFLIARHSVGTMLTRRAGPFVSRMVDGFNRDAFSYLLGIRLAPIFPFWVVNIVPALLNMRFRDYAAATFLGIIPGTLAYAYVGAGLGSVIAAQERADPGCAAAGTCSIDPAGLVTPQIVIAMAGLALISVLPVVLRKFRRASARSD